MLKNLIETERLPPLVANGIPLCSAQYERLFGTTRLPGKEAGVCVCVHVCVCASSLPPSLNTDKLMYTLREASNYLVAYHRGRWYKVPLYHKKKLLNPVELEQ